MTKKNIELDLQKKLADFKKNQDNMSDFELELEKMKGLDGKKKILWSQIYTHALDDRNSALALFTEAYAQLGKTSEDHVILGGVLVKYLEKMTKSNQQLIDLSILISKDEEAAEQINSEDLFKEIEESSGDF